MTFTNHSSPSNFFLFFIDPFTGDDWVIKIQNVTKYSSDRIQVHINCYLHLGYNGQNISENIAEYDRHMKTAEAYKNSNIVIIQPRPGQQYD